MRAVYPPAVTLRRAASADAGPMRALALVAYEPWIAVIGSEPKPMHTDYVRAVDEAEVWVLEDGPTGDLLALMILLRENVDALMVDNLAVRPDQQHRGHGRALLAHAEQRARDLGLAAVTLYTHERMTSNRRLYERLGFEETGREAVGHAARIFYRKPLGSAP